MRLLIPAFATLTLVLALSRCTGSTCEALGGECVGSTTPCAEGMKPALGGGCGNDICCLPAVDAGVSDAGTADAGN